MCRFVFLVTYGSPEKGRIEMNTEIQLAFDHPFERSKASAMAECDRISLRDYVVDVDIGAFQQERGVSQRVRFNIVVEVKAAAQISDDVDRILSYDRVTEAIHSALGDARFNLLETLADRIAELILLEPQAQRAFVRIEKLDRGPGALGVEIMRHENDYEEHGDDAGVEQTIPLVLYLSDDAIQSDFLQDWLTELSTQEIPTILCVGLPDAPRIQTPEPMAQKRIDLLAIEQNAWSLAARDKRCVVIGTRTELDWALKQSNISLWAPSKLVLDATDPPKHPVEDTVALAAWLARDLGCDAMYVIGDETTLEQSIDIRRLPIKAHALTELERS